MAGAAVLGGLGLLISYVWACRSVAEVRVGEGQIFLTIVGILLLVVVILIVGTALLL